MAYLPQSHIVHYSYIYIQVLVTTVIYTRQDTVMVMDLETVGPNWTQGVNDL